jgi:TonB-dependent receptor
MGAKPSSFKKKLLATSISSCMLAVSLGASAQEDGKVLEEVQVFGIRASLEAAMDIKRDSAGVVDAISAEDIGKMPDTNLAESLQRITGVSISRINGEGEKITVRGIDPSLNMVLLNGRTMPSVTNDGTANDTASRAFDFANLASEVVNGVEIYKTGKAELPSGGLGATVNIKTVRPLDLGDNRLSFGAKAIHDTTVDRDGASGDKITPELSGLGSWVNEEGNFGVSLAAAYQKRENSRSSAFINQWNLQVAGEPTFDEVTGRQLTYDGVIPYYRKILPNYEEADLNDPAQRIPVDVSNLPTPGTLYNMPSDLRYVLEDNTRTRKNAMLTLQYEPVENLTATVDYLFSENELEATRAQQSTWYNISAIHAIHFDENLVRTPIIYQESYGGSTAGKDVSFAQQQFNAKTQTNSLGLNLKYKASDALTLEADYHDSRAANKAYRPEAGLNANIVTENYADFGRKLPTMGIRFDDSNPARGNGNGRLDGGDISGAMGTIEYVEQSTDIQQLRLAGNYDLGDLGFFTDSKISFGVEHRKDQNSTMRGDGTSPRITMGNWGGVDPDQFGSDWPFYWSGRNFGDGFPDFDSTTNDPWFLDFGMQGDFNKIVEKMEHMYFLSRVSPDDDIEASNFDNFPNGKFQWNGVVNTQREIKEEVTGAFLHFAAAMQIGGLDAHLAVGLRYEETDVSSVSNVRQPVALEWQDDNDWATLLSSVSAEPVSGHGSYDNLLPNIDFDIAPLENLVVRLSYSETMGRAAYNDLRADTQIVNPYLLTAAQGDPNLKPLESKNFDLSVEWYYDELSYVSAGYFRKDVSNFIGAVTISDLTWYGLRDPRTGPRAQAILDANPGISEKEFHNLMLIEEGKDPANESTSVYATDEDDLALWATNTPVNDKDAVIDGFELAVQHWFGDSGFGIQANYTAVDSDVGFDVSQTGSQFAMIGLSDSANVIGFYDKGPWRLRLAYNWRDEYLNSRTMSGASEPQFIEEYAQVDFSAGYDLNEAISLTFEGLNITGEDSRSHGRSEAQMYSLEDLGARYQVGIRVTF